MSVSALGRWVSKTLGARYPWPLKTFNNPHFERISSSQRIEEETWPDYVATHFYPVRIGELFDSRYQVVGKIGCGAFSTVWLARDLPGRRHVALKVFIHSASLGYDPLREISAYRRLELGPKSHPGRDAVRTLLDTFTVTGPDGEHHCTVHPPLWESIAGLLSRDPAGQLPAPMLAWTMHRLFEALDYANKCKIIHTDIKSSNILFSVRDNIVFENFEKAEIDNPSPRKEVDGRTLYLSRDLEMPPRSAAGLPVLCDFGSAYWGDEENTSRAQPRVYRSPEVILGVPWSYEVDVWNAGLTMWNMFEGGHLFSGTDPEHGEYRARAHLAQMIAMMGPPPPEFLARGTNSSKYFNDKGEFQAGIEVPPRVSLEDIETRLSGTEKALFLQLMRKMLQWDPKNRQTWTQLLEDDWIKMYTVD